MNRETFTRLYRALRSKARRAQAAGPENIKGVSITQDGIVIFDSNWPGSTNARSVAYMTPPEQANLMTPRSTAAMFFALMLREGQTKDLRRIWLGHLRTCPPMPLPQ